MGHGIDAATHPWSPTHSCLPPAEKLEQSESSAALAGRSRLLGSGAEKKKVDDALTRIYRDAAKVTAEQVKGLSAQVVKDLLFNARLAGRPAGTSAGAQPTPMET